MRITTGINRFDKDWKVIDIEWPTLRDRLQNVTRTAETVEEYRTMTKKDRLGLKDVGGFVGGPMERNGERNNSSIHWRSVVTIDVDGDPKNVPDVEQVKAVLDSFACSYVLHSTHSSREDYPRLRAIIPLDREVNEDEYTPIALRIAERIGFNIVDPTTCQKARIMFWPSIPKDASYIFETDGLAWFEPLKASKVLATYVDWMNAAEWPGANEGARRSMIRRHITGSLTDGRVKDPTQKDGWVGAFCRVYSIDDAISEFGLPYSQAKGERYTYTGGSSYGGAIVYGGGRFLYSNHATDPAGGQLCNAFDLVRLHKFGDDDRYKDHTTPATQLPSYKAMTDLCTDIDQVRGMYNQMLLGTAGVPDTIEGEKTVKTDDTSTIEEIDALLGITGGNGPKTAKTEEDSDDKEWMSSLDVSRKNIMATPNNFDLIFQHDENLSDLMREDIFSGRRLVKKPAPWDKEDQTYPREYTDGDAAQLQLYFSRVWKIHGGRDALNAVIDVQMSRDRVHPVKEYLSGLPEWDGVTRADTVLIKYLGAADTALNRAITRKHLCAAVKRVFEPGCKYDQVLILVGPEGTGKSSIIEKLAVNWYMDSNIPVGDKDAYQNLVGHWIVEMGELSDYETKSVAAYKNFVSSQVDRYRPAFGRETISVPRQCVFFGTTNEEGFLKGRTGNRRFWVMDCPGNMAAMEGIFNGELETDLPQIWAEALHYYRKGEPLLLSSSLSSMMRAVQEKHEGILQDSNIEIIREFILMPKPSDWEGLSIEDRKAWYRGRVISGGDFFGTATPTTYLHEFISVKEIALVVFDQRISAKSRYDDDNLYYICDHLSCLKKIRVTRRFGKELGVQKCYKVVRDLPDFDV